MQIAAHPTERFEMTIGITPGYAHANEGAREGVARLVAEAWQQIMEKIGQETGVSVSAVITSGLVAYEKNRGCPEGGESVGVICGVRNPLKCPDAAAWRESVQRIAIEMQERLSQVTAQIAFDSVEIIYFSKK